MNRSTQFLGIAGGVFLLFGVGLIAFQDTDTFSFGPLHLIFGAVLLLIFALKSIKNGFRFGNGRSFKRIGYGAGLTFYSALIVGVLVIANYLSARHQFLHYDSTEQKVYTLSPQMMKVLDGLREPVVMRGFFVGGRVDKDTESLIARMKAYSAKVKWILVDPEAKPQLAEKYGVNEADTIHFSLGTEGNTREAKIVRDLSEQDIINAILKLTRGGEKVVYYVVGHGEPDLNDDQTVDGYKFLKEAIQGENLRLNELNLSTVKDVPSDAAAVIFAAPQKDLIVSEYQTLERYIKSGGNALLLDETRRSRDVANLAKGLGIAVGDDVIVDQVVSIMTGPGLGVTPVISLFDDHPITKDFQSGIILSTAASVQKDPGVDASANVKEFARSSTNSWAERDIERLFSDTPEAEIQSNDIRGPVSVAAAYESSTALSEPQTTKGSSRVVVIGDADFVTNGMIRKLYNRDFFLNALNWAIGEEAQVTVRAKSLRESTVALTVEQYNAMYLFAGILLPESILLIGLGVWWSRRN